MYEYLYDIPEKNLLNYYSGERLNLIANKNFSIVFCSKFELDCLIKEIDLYCYVKPLHELDTIPLSCWYLPDKYLLITLPPTSNLKLDHQYKMMCELVLIKNNPIIICRQFILNKKYI